MYYEINVSKNGSHYFATSSRSINTKDKLKEVYTDLLKCFSEEVGFKITVTKEMSYGQRVSHEEIMEVGNNGK